MTCNSSPGPRGPYRRSRLGSAAVVLALLAIAACTPTSTTPNQGNAGGPPPVDTSNSSGSGGDPGGGGAGNGAGGGDPWPAAPADSGHLDLRGSCPDLRQGDQGPCVIELAWLLNLRGAHLHVTGLFGPITLSRVRQLQAARGLPDTGIVDQATKAALYQVPDPTIDWDLRTDCVDLDYEAEGSCPRSLQHLLMHYGAPLKGTGKYLDNTQTAVRAFQVGHGLTVTGTVGPETKQALYANLTHPSVSPPTVGGTHRTCSPAGCYVYLSRATTAAIAALLPNSAVTDLAAQLLADAACKIVRASLANIICTWGANLAAQTVIDTLRQAAGQHWCFGVHLVLPHSYATLIPIRVLATNDQAYCTP